MRLWTAAFVLLSILFSSGGVAYRPLAEEPQSTPQSAPIDLGAVVAKQSEAQEAPRCEARGSSTIRLDLSKLPRRPGFVSLNTQGYSYRPAGENAHQRVPASAPNDD
jgi:hypothetical protein